MTLAERARRLYRYANFVLKGKKPWSPGYDIYRWDTITRLVYSGDFDKVIGTWRYGYRLDERVVEYPWLFSRLPQGRGILLDAGSTLNFQVLLKHPILREKKVYIATLAPEGVCFWHMGISYIYEDIRSPCFREEFFDYIVCISTLEHIGMDNTIFYTEDQTKAEKNNQDYITAVKIMRSLLKKGGRLYLTMPFGAYKDHGWFQVFNGPMVDEVIEAFGPGSMSEEILQYFDDRWQRSSREKAQYSTCFDIHEQKEYDPDYAAFSRAIVCLELIR